MLETLYNILQKYGITGVVVVVLGTAIVLLIKQVIHNLNDNVDDKFNTFADKITTNNQKQIEVLTNNLQKQQDTLINTLSTNNNKMLNAIISMNPNNKQDHDSKFKGRVISTKELNLKLKEITLECNATFTAVFEFHNNSTNLCGIPFAKFTCSFEWVANRKPATLMTKIISFPFALIEPIVTDLINTDDGRQIIYKDINSTGDVYDALDTIFGQMQNKPKSLIVNGMWDNNDNMIGLMIVGYKDDIPNYLSQHRIQELKFETTQVTSMLNLNYKYNNK